MDMFRLLADLHKDNERQGPGSDSVTRLAMELAGLRKMAQSAGRPLKIADIGCGTGASALILAAELDAQITALDFLPEFLTVLTQRAEKAGVSGKIIPLQASMNSLPFQENEYDVIWSEGAVYNIGFEEGISSWKKFLKPGGILAVSEITWLTDVRPAAIETHWKAEYSEIETASEKIKKLEKCGYSPAAWFALPEECWTDHYYLPLRNQLPDFLKRNGNSDGAESVASMEQKEYELYQKYKKYYSYGFYIAEKL